MYQTAGQLFKLNHRQIHRQSTIKNKSVPKTIVEQFEPSKEKKSMLKTLQSVVNTDNIVKEKQANSDIYYLKDPTVWGPLFWFSLHNGAAKYPENPSSHMKEKVKGFIMGIPYMIPCEKCSEHARDYIESRKNDIDDILADRDSFFKFTYEFHDNANQIIGNERISLEQAQKIYYDDL